MLNWFKKDKRPSAQRIIKMTLYILEKHPFSDFDNGPQLKISLSTDGFVFYYEESHANKPMYLTVDTRDIGSVFAVSNGRCEKYNYGAWVIRLQKLYKDVKAKRTSAQIEAFRDL
jgi:hypothetical protein